MNRALCIIPPDEAWDTLQRARHFACDKTFSQWPPAIRLFHPLAEDSEDDDFALQVAHIIDKFQIDPFEVRLDTWSIVPHVEEMEAQYRALREGLPHQQSSVGESTSTGEGKTDIEQLIEQEERKGKENLRKRMLRRQQKDKAPSATRPPPAEPREKKLLEEQKQMYEEFNGPCVVCLEPSPESRQKIFDLRERLRTELFGEDTPVPYSTTSSVSDCLPHHAESDNYRPVIVVGTCDTVSDAIRLARQLRGLWDPLTFLVTDLQVISRMESEDYRQDTNVWQQDSTASAEAGPFGCDALIHLVGEEVQQDDECVQEIIGLLYEKGEKGGDAQAIPEQPQESVSDTSLSPMEGKTEKLETWLDKDDDFDEGTVVVIGRTHFFTGEMREYVGMPATSVIVDGRNGGSTKRLGTSRKPGWRPGTVDKWGDLQSLTIAGTGASGSDGSDEADDLVMDYDDDPA